MWQECNFAFVGLNRLEHNRGTQAEHLRKIHQIILPAFSRLFCSKAYFCALTQFDLVGRIPWLR